MKVNIPKKKHITEKNLKDIIKIGINFGERLNQISEKCVEDYDSNTLYNPKMLCIYDDYIWECKFTTTGDFDSTKWHKIGDELNLLTKQDIEAMLNLTDEQLKTLSSLILDNEIRLDKTFSSSRIYSDIQQCLSDSKTYTLEQLAKKTGASYKIATSVTDMTSTEYLYLLANANNAYDIYALIDGTAQKIGDTTIDLSQFYTKTEIDNDFLKKVDADGKFATIKTVDKKVDKTSILTTISSTPSDDKLLSEKAIYDKYSFHDLSEANTNVLDDALLVDPHNQNGVNNKDCLVTSSSTQIPDNLLWGIRQVFWHADSDLVLKITGKDINNKGCIWINSLMPKDGGYYWQGWSKNVTSSGSSVSFSKPITIKQVNKCVLSDETFTSKSDDDGGGCVFTAPLGVKTVAFDLISDGIFCQYGLCNMSGTLPTIITTGDNRIEFKNITTSGTYYIKNIKTGSNIYIGGKNGAQISNVRITEWY